MSHNEAIECLSIEIGGVQYIMPLLWAMDHVTPLAPRAESVIFS